jgi:serine/threonine-protein kinase SRK2
VVQAETADTKEQVAIKLITLGDRFYPKYVEREILNHRQLVHPHIVSFKEVFLTRSHLAIVMEFVGGGTLQGWVEKHGRVPEWQARCFFQQLVLALHYSHKSLGISHRDIKLGNILLNDKYQVPILKLCDFGYSKDYSPVGSLPKTRVGTAAYISPEVAGASAGNAAYDSEKADVWSSAVTLYCMLAGRYPFMNGNKAPDLYQIKTLKDKQVDAALDVLSEYGVSNDCKALLKHTLRVAPNKRYGLDQIMENSWYREYLPDLSKMVSRKTEYDQSDEEVRLVLSQAERLSRKIIETGSALDEFDDEMAAEVADELLGSGGDFSFIRRHGRSKDTDDMTIEHQQ